MPVAILVLAAAQAAPAATASQLAIAAFREACVYGNFKLTHGRGSILNDRDTEGWTRSLFQDSILPSEQTVIRLSEPPDTFIVIGRYSEKQRSKYTMRCVMISHAISQIDAFAEMRREGTLEAPVRRYIPDYYFNEWTMPLEDKHNQKYLRLSEGNLTRLEVRQFTKPQ